jgi:tagatose-1,6-bisphosphate aldolase non-catalytic subunit AgaZ/GatZ
VIGLVVQPGVEFGNHNVVDYDSRRGRRAQRALPTCRALSSRRIRPTTRPAIALTALVNDGFAILKVGPGLTFALREALYGLDAIAEELFPGRRARRPCAPRWRR